MTDATFTFRVEEDLKAAFNEAAKSNDQTSAQLLRRFMREYVHSQQDQAEYNGWFRRQVQIGIDAANAGNLVPADEVEAKFSKRRADTRRKIARTST